MEKEKLIKAFNEWMRRFEQEPERFEAEYKSVKRFLKDEAEGREPSYGEACANYLEQLMAEV